jgi:ABC-2 type transport system permease protein
MRAILVLLRKDFAYFRRDRGSVILTFVVPFALIYLFGQIFGVNEKNGGGPTAFPLAVVDASGSPDGQKLVDALRAEKTFKVITTTTPSGGAARPLAEADLKPMMRSDEFRFALVLPPDFARPSALGLHLKLLSDPRNAIEAQTVSGLLEKVIFTQMPSLLGAQLQARARTEIGPEKLQQFDARLADAIASAFNRDREEVYRNLQAGQLGFEAPSLAPSGGEGGDSIFSKVLKIDREQVAGKDVERPVATQLVGGWAMQFLLFALVASATSLFHEKDHGIFQRILSGPVPRSSILWSKFLYGVCLGLIQMAVLFTAGKLLFGIVIGPYLPKLILVWICAAAACSSFGMVLAALAKTPEAARGLATFVILLMSAIGGAWFPVSFMPEFIQHLSRLTLVYWSIEGFIQVLWVHVSLLELLPTLGILAGITALFFSVAWWRFAKGTIFD